MITAEQEQSIRATLAAIPELAVGVGTAEKACSIAALNLALTGTLTDTIPDCMSKVIGRWIISVQDLMPATIRDSAAWRELLVLAAGTGREHERARRALVLDWMWDALALVQPRADAEGYGKAWATMLRERTVTSADAAADAAAAANAAADAAAAASEAAYAHAVAFADEHVAAAASAATAAYAAEDAAAAYAWDTIDPVGCLRRLVAVTDERALAVRRWTRDQPSYTITRETLLTPAHAAVIEAAKEVVDMISDPKPKVWEFDQLFAAVATLRKQEGA